MMKLPFFKQMRSDDEDMRPVQNSKMKGRGEMISVINGGGVKHGLPVFKDRKDIPDFREILSSPGGVYAVKEARRQQVAVLCQKSAAMLLATESFRSSDEYLSLRQRLSTAYPLVLEAITLAPVLLSLYSEVAAPIKGVERKEGDEALSISLFNRIITEAIRQRCTDVHIVILEGATSAVVLYRIDGLVHRAERISQYLAIQSVAVAYNKLAEKGSRSESNFMANVDQSAMIPIAYGDEQYKLRYQSIEVSGGFRVILRILQTNSSKGAEAKPLESLGYSPDQCKLLDSAARKTVGLIVITGPTGSGKSTTLKTLITSSPTRHQRIQYSIEKPVEYKIFGVGQKSIQQSVTDNDTTPMVAAMRALLRADPDEIMVGEVADREMASMLKGFVQSGHPAMTTVHAASAIDIIARLTSDEIGIPRESLSSRNFLTALVFQRLIPLLCTNCRIPGHEASESIFPASVKQTLREKFEVDPDLMFLANPCGCEKCNKTGTKGQVVIAEVIRPDMVMRGMFRDGLDDKAEYYWRSIRTARFDEPDCNGKTALEHGIYKATQGLICPMLLEAMTEPYEDYQVFPIKGVSNYG